MYNQIPSTRDIQGSNFANSNISFPFQVPQGSWSPHDSYFRLRVKITKANGDPLTGEDDIAPNMDIMSNLFTNISLKINGVVCDSVCDYLPQISALKHRSQNSKGSLDGVLSSTNWMQYDQRERLRLVSSDGLDKYHPVTHGVGRLALGYDALNTITMTADGTCTFDAGGGGAPVDPNPFQVGDILFITADGPHIVTSVTSSLIMNVSPGSVFAAGAFDFFRQPATSVPSYDRGNIEIIYKPPLGIMDEAYLPGGKYEFIFSPHPKNNYANMAVETVRSNKAQDTDFKLHVEDFKLYVYQLVNGNQDFSESEDVVLNYNRIICTSESITATGGLQQKNFQLDGKIEALAVAFQDQGYASDTRRSASKFKVQPSSALLKDDLGLTLSRLYIQGPGDLKKPQPDADPSFIKPDDYLTQRYFETLANTGNIIDGESRTDWIERGPYYYFNWSASDTNGEKAHVYYQFSSDLSNKANILFFYFINKKCVLSVQNGEVKQVLI